MATVSNIVLRPRFKIELNVNHTAILEKFELKKTSQSQFIVNRIDDHVFIKFPKAQQHFWSPQLHLEINHVNKNTCLLYGLFGPNPTVWTFFMFLHFMVAGLFVAFGIWGYTNFTLEKEYTIQTSLMLLMVLIWFVLYFGGRIGRASSKKDMLELQNFMHTILNEFK